MLAKFKNQNQNRRAKSKFNYRKVLKLNFNSILIKNLKMCYKTQKTFQPHWEQIYKENWGPFLQQFEPALCYECNKWSILFEKKEHAAGSTQKSFGLIPTC